MDLLLVLITLVGVVIAASTGGTDGLTASSGSDSDDYAADNLLEEIQLRNARNIREAAAATQQNGKPTKKPADKKQKAKAKDQGCGKLKGDQEPPKPKEGGRHKPIKVADASCPPPNLGHPYEVISMEHVDDDVEEEPERDVPSKPSVNQTAVFLNIMKDLSSLKNATAPAKTNSTDGIPAHLTGVWLSETAGLRFSLQERPAQSTTTQVPTPHQQQPPARAPRGEVRVTVAERRVKPREKLLSTDWTYTATAPVVTGSPFFIIALQKDEKRIAVFIGQAKVCSQQEVMYGGWLFGKQQPAASCREAALNVWTRDEVMRRGRPAGSKTPPANATECTSTSRPSPLQP